MQPMLYPALACAVTAVLAGGCGLLYVGGKSRERVNLALTFIFTCIVSMGLGGVALLLTL